MNELERINAEYRARVREIDRETLLQVKILCVLGALVTVAAIVAVVVLT